jgi:hypothetical protein
LVINKNYTEKHGQRNKTFLSDVLPLPVSTVHASLLHQKNVEIVFIYNWQPSKEESFLEMPYCVLRLFGIHCLLDKVSLVPLQANNEFWARLMKP